MKKAIEVREKFLNRKQVRYLGIVIEKDEEYRLDTTDIRRTYIPTKGKYMEAVKESRVLFMDCMERNKGLAELPKTVRKLHKKTKEIRFIKNQDGQKF